MRTASDIFSVKTIQQPNCTNEGYMPNYIVIFGISFNEYKYNIHSRSTLLDAANSNMLFHKNNGSGSKLQLKPLVFNNGLDLPKSINSCVRHVIYCLFPYQCILSIPSDPLLVRIKQLYNKMVNDFWNSLPGFSSNSISVLKNTPSFHIHTPYCHEFAACYGIEPMSESHQILVTKSFSAMQNAENYVLNLPEFKKFKKCNTCDPFVVICYSSGQCKVFLYSELDKELTRGKTQLFGENIGMTTDSWTNQSLILKNAAEIQLTATISIYFVIQLVGFTFSHHNTLGFCLFSIDTRRFSIYFLFLVPIQF